MKYDFLVMVNLKRYRTWIKVATSVLIYKIYKHENIYPHGCAGQNLVVFIFQVLSNTYFFRAHKSEITSVIVFVK